MVDPGLEGGEEAHELHEVKEHRERSQPLADALVGTCRQERLELGSGGEMSVAAGSKVSQ